MNNSKIDQTFMFKETKRAKIALGLGIGLMIFLPLLFTQKWGIISFMNTGQIGDTIGGITAPISGLLGAYLVFLALKAQVEANRILKDQMILSSDKEIRNNEVLIIEKLLDRLEKKIREFKITQPDTYEYNPKIIGKEGIRAVIINFLSYAEGTKPIDMMNGYFELSDLMDKFDYTFTRIEKLPIEDRNYFVYVFEDIYSGISFDTGLPEFIFGEANFPNETVSLFVNRFIFLNKRLEEVKAH